MKKGAILGRRDLEILRAVFEHKVVDVKCIHELFFLTANINVCRKRLLRLSKEGFLTQGPIAKDGKYRSIYYSTEKGVGQLQQVYHHLIERKVVKSASVNHDLNLLLVRRRMNGLKMLEDYFTENMIQACADLTEKFRSFAQVNSDAVMAINTPHGLFNVALEFEDSPKSKDRYRAKLMDYYIRGDIHLVFYLCTTPHLISILGEIDRPLSEKFSPKVFLGLFDDVMNAKENLVFYNHSKLQIVLN